MNQIKDLIALFIVCVYNLIILGGTTYVVVWHNASYWLFALAILLISGFAYIGEKKKDKL